MWGDTLKNCTLCSDDTWFVFSFSHASTPDFRFYSHAMRDLYQFLTTNNNYMPTNLQSRIAGGLVFTAAKGCSPKQNSWRTNCCAFYNLQTRTDDPPDHDHNLHCLLNHSLCLLQNRHIRLCLFNMCYVSVTTLRNLQVMIIAYMYNFLYRSVVSL